MHRKLIWAVVAGAAIVAGVGLVGNLSATPSSGFAGTTIAKGRFGDIEVMNHLVTKGDARERSEKSDRKPWFSLQKTKGPSDLYVQNNAWSPGGSTGWHTHPGHSLIIVTAGTVTGYESDDPDCTPHVYTTGMGFVDPGGDHVHLLRNEGDIEARTVAVQLIPADAVRRVGGQGPAGCPL